MAAAIEVDGLSKAYGEVQALDDVSLTVSEGTCTALLGPNGAGKSTLLSILATLRQPDAGRAQVAGASVLDAPGEVRRALGVLFQEPLVSKHLTAREVLLHHARLYGVRRPERQERADEMLAFVELTERAEDRVATFSGGMKRRLDLARVLMTRPQVLILDEPTTGLDVRGRSQVHARVRELISGGTTVLLASHDLDEARTLAGRVAILDRGRLLEEDAPSRLARRLGRRVVRVEITGQRATAALEEARYVLGELGNVLETGDGVEVLLGASANQPETHATPGEVVDALDRAGVTYDRVTVREPDLGDVFLELTGRSLEAEQVRRAGSEEEEVAG